METEQKPSVSEEKKTDNTKGAGSEWANNIKSTAIGLPLWGKLCLGGGIAYLVALFLPYMKIDIGGEYIKGLTSNYSINDDGGIWFITGLIIAIVSIVIPFINIFAKNIKLPLPKQAIYLILGVLGAALPFIRWLLLDNRKYIDFAYGTWLLLAAGLVIAYGGFKAGGMKMLQDKIQKK